MAMTVKELKRRLDLLIEHGDITEDSVVLVPHENSGSYNKDLDYYKSPNYIGGSRAIEYDHNTWELNIKSERAKPVLWIDFTI
jgi:hypothetical protein